MVDIFLHVTQCMSWHLKSINAFWISIQNFDIWFIVFESLAWEALCDDLIFQCYRNVLMFYFLYCFVQETQDCLWVVLWGVNSGSSMHGLCYHGTTIWFMVKFINLLSLFFLLLSEGSKDNPTKPVQLKKRIKLNRHPRLNKQQLNLNSLGVVPSDFTKSGLTTKGTIQLLAGSGSVLLNTDII